MNRTSGAYAREIWHNFGLHIELIGGGSIQFVESAPTRKMAIAKAFRACQGAGVKVLFCKRADEMSRDERGQFDLLNDNDHAHEARENRERAANWWHNADMY